MADLAPVVHLFIQAHFLNLRNYQPIQYFVLIMRQLPMLLKREVVMGGTAIMAPLISLLQFPVVF
jgi:hypothetical protein